MAVPPAVWKVDDEMRRTGKSSNEDEAIRKEFRRRQVYELSIFLTAVVLLATILSILKSNP
jgi:uncharacterized membrane protein